MPSDGSLIDVHAHAIPEKVLSLIRDKGRDYGGIEVDSSTGHDVISFPGATPLRPLPPRMKSGPERAEWMNDQGVALQLVAPWMDVQGMGLPAGDGVPWVAALNDAMAEGLPDLQSDVGLMASLYLPSPEDAAAELARAVRDLGAVGAMIPTHFAGGGSAADDGMDAVWEVAAELGAPIVLHPPIKGPASAIEGYDEYRSLYGRTMETSLVGTRLLIGGVFQRFPGVRIVLVHGGGFLPFQAGRIDQQVHAGKIPYEYGDEGAPSQVAQQFFYDTAMMAPVAVRFLQDFAPGRVVVGTDHPFTASFEDLPRLVDALSPEDAAQVGHEVATELFSLQQTLSHA